MVQTAETVAIDLMALRQREAAGERPTGLSERVMAQVKQARGQVVKDGQGQLYVIVDRSWWLKQIDQSSAPLPNTESSATTPDRSGIAQRTARIIHQVARAGRSIAKTTLGIDRATPVEVEARLNVCRRCPGGHATWSPGGGDVHTCGPMIASITRQGKGPCGCILRKKALDRAEHCPFGWWPGDDSPAA